MLCAGSVQDVGVAALRRHRIALGPRGLQRQAGRGWRKRAADEVAPPGARLGDHGLDTVAAQKVLRRLADPSCAGVSLLHAISLEKNRPTADSAAGQEGCCHFINSYIANNEYIRQTSRIVTGFTREAGKVIRRRQHGARRVVPSMYYAINSGLCRKTKGWGPI